MPKAQIVAPLWPDTHVCCDCRRFVSLQLGGSSESPVGLALGALAESMYLPPLELGGSAGEAPSGELLAGSGSQLEDAGECCCSPLLLSPMM